MRAKFAVLVLSIALLINGTGCFSVIKRVGAEVIGATSSIEPVPSMDIADAARYHGVKIEKARTDLGGLLDPRFKAALPGDLEKKLTKNERNDKGEVTYEAPF